MRSGLPAIAMWRRNQSATRDNEMQMGMLLHDLTPSVQNHRKANFAAEIFLPKLFEELCGSLNQQVVHQLCIERNQRIENVVNRENDMVIMNGKKPDLLGFKPLRFFERTAFWTVAILAGFEMEFPTFTFGARLQHATHRRRAAIHNRAHGFGLLIRKPMSAFVFAYVSSENFSHIIFQSLAVVRYIFYKFIFL